MFLAKRTGARVVIISVCCSGLTAAPPPRQLLMATCPCLGDHVLDGHLFLETFPSNVLFILPLEASPAAERLVSSGSLAGLLFCGVECLLLRACFAFLFASTLLRFHHFLFIIYHYIKNYYILLYILLYFYVIYFCFKSLHAYPPPSCNFLGGFTFSFI